MLDLYNKIRADLNQRKSIRSHQAVIPENNMEKSENSHLNIEIDEIQTESLKNLHHRKEKSSKGSIKLSKSEEKKTFSWQYLSNDGHDSDVVLPVWKIF